nr:MAG TPA: hypothetical protein [Caudoviricetes sp.]
MCAIHGHGPEAAAPGHGWPVLRPGRCWGCPAWGTGVSVKILFNPLYHPNK